MRAWQYATITNGIENSLRLNASAAVPKQKPDEHLVEIQSCALNPVDYKPAESPLLRRVAIPNPATPGIDIVGKILQPAAGSALKQGSLVYGAAATKPFAAGGLTGIASVPTKCVIPLPAGLAAKDAAAIPVAALTAYQTIVPYVQPGSRVFINGGSGGTGIFSLQIAKVMGCHVTTSCSTANVDLCKSLGANEVIDYKKGSLLDTLKSGKPFDHVVDNVGSDHDLFWRAHEYSTPSAKYIWVAASPALSYLTFSLKARFWPTFLGGAKRPFQSMFTDTRMDQLEQIGKWAREGKVKVIIDERFAFEKAPDAFRKLKTSRAKGKIVIDVASD